MTEFHCDPPRVIDALSTSGNETCLERCPDGFIKKEITRVTHPGSGKKVREESMTVNVCTKPGLEMSERLMISRAVRRSMRKRDTMPDGFVYKYFPDRVVDRSGSRPRLNLAVDTDALKSAKNKTQRESIIDSTVQSKDYAACEFAAMKMKRADIGDKRIFGTFAMMANIQRDGTLAKDVFTKCRDRAYCKIHKMNGKECPAR